MNTEPIDLALNSGDPEWMPVKTRFADTTTGDAFYFNDSNMAQWVVEATRKLDGLARRKADWDSYGGLELRLDAKRLTLEVLRWLQGDSPVRSNHGPPANAGNRGDPAT